MGCADVFTFCSADHGKFFRQRNVVTDTGKGVRWEVGDANVRVVLFELTDEQARIVGKIARFHLGNQRHRLLFEALVNIVRKGCGQRQIGDEDHHPQ